MSSRPPPDDFSSERTAVSMMPVGAIQVDSNRIRHDLGNIKQLAENIALVGLLHPIVVTMNGKVVAGARRLEALKHLGWKEIPVTIMVRP